MPQSNYIEGYPIQLYSIVENVLLTQKEVKVTTADNLAAEKLRRQVYGLRDAILLTAEHPLKASAPKITTQRTNNILFIRHIDAYVDPGLIKAAEELDNDQKS